MHFDDIDIRAEYSLFDAHEGGVAPTRDRIARERRMAEIRRRERDRKAELAVPFTAFFRRMAATFASRLRKWRRPLVGTGPQPRHCPDLST